MPPYCQMLRRRCLLFLLMLAAAALPFRHCFSFADYAACRCHYASATCLMLPIAFADAAARDASAIPRLRHYFAGLLSRR